MKFRTEIDIIPFIRKIDHGMRGFSIGSCFAESMARKLCRSKFQLESNTFGVLYNPFSIASALESLSNGRVWSKCDLSTSDGIWFSYDHHGSFSSTSASQTVAAINEAACRGAAALSKADYVIITFGTAWVFEYEGRVVANCHKQPSTRFSRRKLTVDEIITRFSGLLEGSLKNTEVIFTVSPVRHLKDGFEENSLSKSILRLAVAELVEGHNNALYFPAYEIVNDDLRDYRFYANDLVHPSESAVEYVWEKFAGAAFSDETRNVLPGIENIVRAAEHRPFNPQSEAHAELCRRMMRQTGELAEKYPVLDFTAEMDFFGKGLQ